LLIFTNDEIRIEIINNFEIKTQGLIPSEMISCTRSNSENEDFHKLVKELDADLAIRDGKDHSFYARFNKIDAIKYVIVAYDNEIPVGCGAIKEYAQDTMEVKRMYVPLNRRAHGIASIILKELEQWAIELSYTKCILETGEKQPEAIALYKKNGYRIMPNFGQYENVKNSVCFEKKLKD
jgi:GNAT superfamily N-acetyltransferase